jgi:hypothetical protein
MDKKEFEAHVDSDKIREIIDLSDSKIHMKIIFNKDDIVPFVLGCKNTDILSALNAEQVSAILGITMGFLQELIHKKSDNKVLLELIPDVPESINKDKLH